MAVCAPCTLTEEVPSCLTNLIIGTISSTNTDVHVYQKHILTGRVVRYDVTTSGAGLVTIEVEDIMQDQIYEYWVVLDTATSIEDRETITINADTYTCVTVPFVKVMQSDGDPQSYATITLNI